MTYQLNAHFETFFLLINSKWGRKQKKEAIKELDAFGINGAVFYATHFSLIEQYYADFQSKYVEIEGVFDLSDMCEEVLPLYVQVFWQHPEWFEDPVSISDEEAYTTIRQSIIDPSDEVQDEIAYLESLDLSDKVRWQIAALLQQPQQRLTSLAQAVRANLSAFEYAYAQQETAITQLLAQFEDRTKKGSPALLFRLTDEFSTDVTIIPTLALPLVIMVLDSVCFCGLLADKAVAQEEGDFTKDEALRVAKALGDPSKLDILLALKRESLYGLEIANELGLTPATTSHHMNTLIGAGLVNTLKQDGKIFYSVSEDGLKRYRDWLNTNLL